MIGVGSSLPFAEQASQPTKERNEKWVCFGCGGAQRSWKLITNQINSPTARLHLICLIICFPSPFHFSNPIKQTSHFVCLMELKGNSFPLLSALHASWISFSFVYVGRSSSLLAGCLWRSALITHHQTNSAGQLQQNQKKIHSAYAWGRRQLNKPN